MKITPLREMVFIKPEIQDVTPGGIILSRGSRQMPDRGVIIGINHPTAEKFGLEIGDRVLFDKHKQKMHRDEAYTVLEADDIVALLT